MFKFAGRWISALDQPAPFIKTFSKSIDRGEESSFETEIYMKPWHVLGAFALGALALFTAPSVISVVLFLLLLVLAAMYAAHIITRAVNNMTALQKKLPNAPDDEIGR